MPVNEEPTKVFLIAYRYDGAEWALELKARDAEDAKARLAVLPFARLDGEVVQSYPAYLGPLAIVATAVRNGLRRVIKPHLR